MSIPYILTINVRYREGTKAHQFFSRASPDAIAQVKQDLQNLNFPIADCNISFVYPRCMKATWIATLSSVRITNRSILARDTELMATLADTASLQTTENASLPI